MKIEEELFSMSADEQAELGLSSKIGDLIRETYSLGAHDVFHNR